MLIRTIYIVLLFFISLSCGRAGSKNIHCDYKELEQVIALDSINVNTCHMPKVNLSEFAKYQSFDEFSMSGIGDPNKQPFV